MISRYNYFKNTLLLKKSRYIRNHYKTNKLADKVVSSLLIRALSVRLPYTICYAFRAPLTVTKITLQHELFYNFRQHNVCSKYIIIFILLIIMAYSVYVYIPK